MKVFFAVCILFAILGFSKNEKTMTTNNKECHVNSGRDTSELFLTKVFK